MTALSRSRIKTLPGGRALWWGGLRCGRGEALKAQAAPHPHPYPDPRPAQPTLRPDAAQAGWHLHVVADVDTHAGDHRDRDAREHLPQAAFSTAAIAPTAVREVAGAGGVHVHACPRPNARNLPRGKARGTLRFCEAKLNIHVATCRSRLDGLSDGDTYVSYVARGRQLPNGTANKSVQVVLINE